MFEVPIDPSPQKRVVAIKSSALRDAPYFC